MSNLVIVESPAKAKTIESFLGKDYKVIATIGHLIDLPKSKLGVDVDKNFKPKYVTMPGKRKVVSNLKKALAGTKGDVILALDPDREGESIAWQVQHKFKLKDKYYRVVFHEITKNAIQQAMKKKGKINDDLVDAQKARRILDRLVGYPLSQLLWKKIRYGLSAGRVQSAALRLVVEREEEINKFDPEEYWEIWADVAHEKVKKITSRLHKVDGKRIKINNKTESEEILKHLKKATWKVKSVTKKVSQSNPPPPFITATLQQYANRVLGYSAKQTMATAQRLYQGINIKGLGQKSLITYMRTDSVALSKVAISGIQKFVKKEYGDEYLAKDIRRYRNKAKLSQEAHEAIRPTYFDLPPSKLKDKLGKNEFRLYQLIWNRTVATQMAQIKYDVLNVEIAAKDDKEYIFPVQAKTVAFAGYGKLYPNMLKNEEIIENLSELKANDPIDLKKLDPQQHYTKPPARYSEASLIKKLKDLGIGRPSTYASIISTIMTRNYIIKENKLLRPTDTGIVVTHFLEDHFPKIVDYEFTSNMEEDLDGVASGDLEWKKPIADFWESFNQKIEKKTKSIDKQDVVVLEDSEEKCPDCGGEMVVRLGRFGKFHSCKKYPDCKGMLPFADSNALNPESEEFQEKYEPAPVIDGIPLILKQGRFGYFWAHPDYPKVKEVRPLLLKEKCPECGSSLVERKGKFRRTFIGCSGYPKCRYIKKNKKS